MKIFLAWITSCLPRRRHQTFSALTLSLALAGNAAAGQLAKLTIQPEKSAQVDPTYRLSWDSVPGTLYRLQRSTDLGKNVNWLFGDAIIADSANTQIEVKGRSIPENSVEFFRLEAHPEIFSVEPTFVDSSDTNAGIYLLGQLLPTNATVIINGHSITPTIINSNGVWAFVRLNGLPPGEPVIGTLTVIDNGTSNVVATMPVQSPILFGTEMTLEQLQGPPPEPPAVVKTKTKSNQSNDRLIKTKTKSNQSNDRLIKTKTKSNQSNDRLIKTKTKSNQSNDRVLTGGYGWNVSGANLHAIPNFIRYQLRSKTTEAKVVLGGIKTSEESFLGGATGFFKSVSGLESETEVVPYREGGVNDSVRRTHWGVFLATGELRGEETDLVIPCPGIDFAWTRTYCSRTGPTTSLGHGWDFSYNMRLSLQPDGTVQFCSGNGRCDTFYPNGTNGWSRDEFFMTIGDLNKDGIPDVVICANGTRVNFNPVVMDKPVSIVDRNNNVMSFYYDAVGRLSTIVDTLGRSNTVSYGSSGLLESLTDFSGRTMRYEYDGHGDLVRVVSPPVTGTPNGNDFPGGKTNRYAYTSGFQDDRLNHNLTSMSDAKGQTWLQVVYQPTNNPASPDFDAVSAIVRGGLYHEYLTRVPQKPALSNQFAVVKCIMSDAVGNVTECFYDSRFRCVRALEYTGRSNPDLPVTENSNRPTGKLRADDPDFFETQWTWNPDSRIKAMYVNPRSIARQQYVFVYERDFNPNANPRKKGDLRVARQVACCSPVDMDGDGIGDTSELAWHFEYDPNFGSPAREYCVQYRESDFDFVGGKVQGNAGSWPLVVHAHGTGGNFRGPRQTVSLDGSYSPDGVDRFGRPAINTALNSSAKAINTKGTGATLRLGEICDPTDCDDSFVTSVTDPGGTVTTGNYDTNGNLLQVTTYIKKSGQVATADFDYKAQSYRLAAITNAPDGNGYRRVDTFEYYTNGPMSGYVRYLILDSTGDPATVELQYDARGNPIRVIDPRGFDTLYTYNQLDELVRFETPTNITARCATDFTYDENGNVVQVATEKRDAADAKQAYYLSAQRYDVFDQKVLQIEQVATNHFITNRFDYDGNGNVTALHSPMAETGADPNSIALFRYDERGLPFQEIIAPNSPTPITNQWNYDPNGNLSTTHNFYVGPNYDRVYAYDGFGRPVSVTDAMSNVVTYAYDRNGNLIQARAYGELNDGPGNAGNVRLSECRWKYNDLGQCTEASSSFFDPATQGPIGDGLSVSTYTYAPNGQLTTATDDNGHVTLSSYDTHGRLSSLTDPKTNIFMLTYDPCDNVTVITSIERSDLTPAEQRFTRSFAYDSQNRCTRTVDNVGNTNRYAYNSRGLVVTGVDPVGNTGFSFYDDLGRRTLAIADMNGDGNPDAAVDANHSWTYDDNSRCTSSTDDNTNTTLYFYDSLNRPVMTQYADGTHCSLVWSPRSNLARVQDPNGTVITNMYDGLDRVVRRDIVPGPAVAATTTHETFAYDGVSQLVAATNDNSHCEYAYNSLGRTTRGTSGGIGALVTTTARIFDGVGNCTSVTYPGGRVVSYGYNTLDEITSITTPLVDGAPPVVIATYDYEGPGRVGRIMRANGVGTRVNWDGTINPPNPVGDLGWRQVARVNHQAATGGAVIDRRSLAYDRNQNKILRAQTVPFTAQGATLTNTFEYDPVDRLSRAINTTGTGATVRMYVLDGNGNRQNVISNGIAQPYTMDSASPPSDFQMNQYTLTPFGIQTYDENGNLISRSSATSQLQYQYDFDDRLVAVNDLSTGVPTPLATFAYDALGHRISKTSYPPAPLNPVTTEYVYGRRTDPYDFDSDGDLIIEARQPGVIDSYVHKEDDGMTVYSLRTGGGPHFYYTDDLNTVLAIGDTGTNVLERYEYDDFGAPRFLESNGSPLATSVSLIGNPFLFHGMEWDGETELYFNPKEYSLGIGARGTFTDPKTGQSIRRGQSTRDSDGLVFNVVNPRAGRVNPWSKLTGRPVGQPSAAGLGAHVQRSFFQAGDKPTEAQFGSFIDSCVNLMDDRNLLGLHECSAKIPRTILKAYFETGDVPTSACFIQPTTSAIRTLILTDLGR